MRLTGGEKIGLLTTLVVAAASVLVTMFIDQKWIAWSVVGLCGAGVVAIGIHHWWDRLKGAGRWITSWRVRSPLTRVSELQSAAALPLCAQGNTPLSSPSKNSNNALREDIEYAAEQINKREYIDKSPKDLLSFYKSLTPLQANQLMQPFFGTWVQAPGVVLNVLEGGIDIVAVVKSDGVAVECRFDKSWDQKLMRLSTGDRIVYQGRIRPDQNGSQLYLDNCELA
jgi:hypothetical protein